jgi:GrpB-like predicted nucleotidyltransferase (UPF0157 family)
LPSPSYKIVEYDPDWPDLFDQEKARVVAALGIGEERVQHIGSTAVPGLGAKPIVDMMAGIPSMAQAPRYLPLLEAMGYEWRGETVPGTLYIRKAAPRRFNLHMTEYGGAFWETHLLFRDYLRAHPNACIEYEALKRALMSTLAGDPPAYNDGKTDFIRAIVAGARDGLD